MPKDTKAPPVLKDGGSYAKWKHEVAAWQILTDLPKEKQAVSLFMYGMEGTCQDLISKLPISDLNKEGGVKLITDALDIYCEANLAQREYSSYEKVHQYKRTPGKSISASLLEFDALVCEMKSLKIELPTTVLAYHVLHAMDIGEDNEKLARATVTTLNYESMCTKIKAIMDTVQSAPTSVKTESGQVKVEPESKTCAYRE